MIASLTSGLTVEVASAPSAVAQTVESKAGQFYPMRGRVWSDVQVAAGATSTVQIAGVAWVPASNVASVALVVSAKGQASTPGSVTVYPYGASEPLTTTVSYRSTNYAASTSIVKLGTDGKINVTNKGSAAVKIYLDVHGYTLSTAGTDPGSTYVALNPARVAGNVTVGGQAFSEFSLLGKGGVPSSGVESVALTLVAKGSGTGTIRVYPVGDGWPFDATIDYPANSYQQNFTIARLGTDGKVTIHNFGWSPVSIWIDVVGYTTKSPNVPAGAIVKPLEPARLLDNVDIAAGGTRTLSPLGLGGLPESGVVSAGLSVTAKSSTGTGSIEAYPTGVSDPGVHTVAYDAVGNTTAFTSVRVGSDGKIVLRNTGSVTATVSVDVSGYFEDSAPGNPGQLTATPQAETGAELVMASTTPELSATATDPDGGTLDYAFQVAREDDKNAIIASGTAGNVPSGTAGKWSVPAGNLESPGLYAFRVKASDANYSTGWTAWKSLSIDAPHMPAALATAQEDTPNPILSGVVSRASGRPVTGRFYLYDSNDVPVGPSPLGEGTVDGGQRVALQVPDGLIQAGHTYKFSMAACDGGACSARTPLVSFTAASPPAPPATQDATMGRDHITIKTAKVGDQACAGAACPLTVADSAAVGGVGGDETVSHVAVGLGDIPVGATITSATLTLGAPTCSGTCPADPQLAAYEPEGALPDTPTGVDAIANLSDEALATTQVAAPSIDITGVAQDRSAAALVLRLPGGPAISYADTASIKVDLKYVPPTAPGAIDTVTARAGDGGLLAAWAAPENLGAQINDPTFDVQVRDASDQVVKVLSQQGSSAVITGLNNGSDYRVLVRTTTAFGSGPWASTGQIRPVAVPGGTQQYVDAIHQYLDAKQAIIEGRYADAVQAVAASSQGTLFNVAIQTIGWSLFNYRQALQAHGTTQTGSTTEVTSPLASYSATDGTVTLRAVVNSSTTRDDGSGTPKVSDASDVIDYVFQLGGNPSVTGLNQLWDGAGVDAAAGDPQEVNALPTGETSPAADMPEIPVDADGFPTGAAAPGFTPTTQAVTSARAGYNQTGAATWAYNNVFSQKANYSNDCANFISKAMNRGGGLIQVKGYNGGSANDIRNWWGKYISAPKVGATWGSTRSWRLVEDQFSHLAKRKRINPKGWRATHDDVRVGDLVFWYKKGAKHWTHVTIVTEVRGHGARRDILTTSHTSTYRNESVFAEKRANWVPGFIPVLD